MVFLWQRGQRQPGIAVNWFFLSFCCSLFGKSKLNRYATAFLARRCECGTSLSVLLGLSSSECWSLGLVPCGGDLSGGPEHFPGTPAKNFFRTVLALNHGSSRPHAKIENLPGPRRVSFRFSFEIPCRFYPEQAASASAGCGMADSLRLSMPAPCTDRGKRVWPAARWARSLQPGKSFWRGSVFNSLAAYWKHTASQDGEPSGHSEPESIM